jgi:uncharacterized protein
MSQLNPFLLAASTPSPDPRLLPLLRSDTSLASAQDAHGYSLLHAASSYNHIDLLKTLVSEFSVDINLQDEDGETCLFVAEDLSVVKCLVEELGIDKTVKNGEGMNAVEKFESENEYPEIAMYLRQQAGEPTAATDGNSRMPPLPPNVSIGLNSTDDESAIAEQQPDPDFRRRIEELAARDDFQSEEGQRELRELITDAVRGVSDERDVRRRVE